MSDTEARDRLAHVIVTTPLNDWGDTLTEAFFNVAPKAEMLADAILAAGFRPPARTVSTVEEAEALPDGTLIVDRQRDSGYVWQGLVHYPETAVLPVDYALKHHGPFKVHYEPKDGE